MNYDKLIEAHVRALMPEELQQLKATANWSLHFGPLSVEDGREAHGVPNWNGYEEAIETLEEWARESMPSTLYVIPWVPEVCDALPEETDDAIEYDRRAIARIIFGKLISDGGLSV